MKKQALHVDVKFCELHVKPFFNSIWSCQTDKVFTKLKTGTATTRLRLKNHSVKSKYQNNNFARASHVFVHFLAVHRLTNNKCDIFTREEVSSLMGTSSLGEYENCRCIKKSRSCPAHRVVILGFLVLTNFKDSNPQQKCYAFGQVPHPWVSCQKNPNLYYSWAKDTKKTKLN